jgi:hypothetical protein
MKHTLFCLFVCLLARRGVLNMGFDVGAWYGVCGVDECVFNVFFSLFDTDNFQSPSFCHAWLKKKQRKKTPYSFHTYTYYSLRGKASLVLFFVAGIWV